MLEVPWRAVLPVNNQSINQSVQQLSMCTIYGNNLHQYHKINVRGEIHVAYGYEKNKKYLCGNHNYLQCQKRTTHKYSMLLNVNLGAPATISKNEKTYTQHKLFHKQLYKIFECYNKTAEIEFIPT